MTYIVVEFARPGQPARTRKSAPFPTKEEARAHAIDRMREGEFDRATIYPTRPKNPEWPEDDGVAWITPSETYFKDGTSHIHR